MNDIAARGREAPPRDLWRSIPLDCIVCALGVIAAAGLKLAGLMP